VVPGVSRRAPAGGRGQDCPLPARLKWADAAWTLGVETTAAAKRASGWSLAIGSLEFAGRSFEPTDVVLCRSSVPAWLLRPCAL
jgi:hypothetical protein